MYTRRLVLALGLAGALLTSTVLTVAGPNSSANGAVVAVNAAEPIDLAAAVNAAEPWDGSVFADAGTALDAAVAGDVVRAGAAASQGAEVFVSVGPSRMDSPKAGAGAGESGGVMPTTGTDGRHLLTQVLLGAGAVVAGAALVWLVLIGRRRRATDG